MDGDKDQYRCDNTGDDEGTTNTKTLTNTTTTSTSATTKQFPRTNKGNKRKRGIPSDEEKENVSEGRDKTNRHKKINLQVMVMKINLRVMGMMIRDPEANPTIAPDSPSSPPSNSLESSAKISLRTRMYFQEYSLLTTNRNSKTKDKYTDNRRSHCDSLDMTAVTVSRDSFNDNTGETLSPRENHDSLMDSLEQLIRSCHLSD